MLATEPQMRYLKRLLAERPSHPLSTAGMPAVLLKVEASSMIEALLASPVEQALAPSARLVLQGTAPAKGTFTVVLGRKERRTLRFQEGRYGVFAGKTVVAVMTGSDNERSYTGVGSVVDAGVHVWQKHAGDQALQRALAVLLKGPDAQAKAGEAYAIEASRCWRCNRTLTVPVSVARGLGPECARGGA